MRSFRLYLYDVFVRLLPETRFWNLKSRLLRWCGAKVGLNVRIGSSAVFLGDGRLEIGDDVWIGAGCRISPIGNAVIKIGSRCDFGPEVMILTGSHEIDIGGSHIAGRGLSKSVTIGEGCWLGARSTILPGVTLAQKTLVAAGAVVTRSIIREKTLVAGVPAVEKKEF